MRRGLPVGRYLLSVPAAALVFVGLAVVDQRATFLSALQPGAPSAPSASPDRLRTPRSG